MGVSARAHYVILTSLVLIILAALIIGLTVGLRTPAPPNGGSPVGPPMYNLTEVGGPADDEDAVTGTPPPQPPPWPESISESYRYSAVTTDTIPCSTIGVDVLGNGGSAVDAAIASGLCMGVINHHSCGIGGGHFMTGYEKPRGSDQRELFSILSREWAPLAATEDMFVNNTDASSKGGLSIATPGDVMGYYTAWERYGVLPWADLFTPTINLCNQGFTVERSLAGAIDSYEDDIRADPNLSELFVKPNGDLVAEGDILVNAKLGTTLTRIAEDPFTFYNGSLADDIVADLQEYGAIITKEDLLAYRSKVKDPLVVSLSNGDLKAYAPRPPSSGAIFQFILNILNGYRFGPDDITNLDDKILAYHRIVEAFKFAYAKRSELGDEDFVDVQELLANLTSVNYGEGIRAQVNDSSTQGWQYYGPDFDLTPDSGTAHHNVQTRDGSAVAVTSTINLFFGSNVRGSRTGIMFNDEMDDFSTPGTSNSFGVPASPANYIFPGKMPMSSMCPTLVLDADGNVVFMSGASGGTRITTGTAFELLDGFIDKNHDVSLYGSIAVVGSIHNTCPLQSKDAIYSDHCIHATVDGRKGGVPDGMD